MGSRTISHNTFGDYTHVHQGDMIIVSAEPLPTATGAMFDSYAEAYKPQCHPDTRIELLSQVQSWAHDPLGESIFWLNGMAGTGKSTISRTVATTLSNAGLLGASFLFKRGEGDRDRATLFFTTIATQLMTRIPSTRPFVRSAVDADPYIFQKAFKDQLSKLILQPLCQAGSTTTVVVDALYECDGDNDTKAIIFLLSEDTRLVGQTSSWLQGHYSEMLEVFRLRHGMMRRT